MIVLLRKQLTTTEHETWMTRLPCWVGTVAGRSVIGLIPCLGPCNSGIEGRQGVAGLYVPKAVLYFGQKLV